MKIAIIKSDELYSLRMKDASGTMSASFLSFIRNVIKEVGKNSNTSDWDFSIGVSRRDSKDHFEVYEVQDYMGYLFLEYQRNLLEWFSRSHETESKLELNPF